MADSKRPMSEEESLKRSHSKFSNFKLTLICLLCALSVTLLAASLATIGSGLLLPKILVPAIIVSGLLTLLSLFLIARFKR